MSDEPAVRRPRGNYAPLICLDCRSRKIKCALPEQVKIEPSDVPQDPCSSCQRCRHLGLECIVQRTILGRPAAKRKRVALDSSIPTSSSHDLDSTQVSDYLLSGAPDADQEGAQAARRKINEREMWEALLSPARLMAAHLARDKHFGSETVPPSAQRPVSLMKLVSNGMATLLDERIAFLPPSCRLREDSQLRQDLRAAVMHYGQQMLFTLPTHRYTLIALVLMYQYKPAVLAPSQAAASAALRGDLYIGLAKRVAQRLGIDTADLTLQELMSSPGGADTSEMDQYLIGALQWCEILIHEAFHDGFMTKLSSLMQDTIDDVERVLQVADVALQVYAPALPVRMFVYEMKTSQLVAKSTAQVKRGWEDIALLTAIVDNHEAAFDSLQSEFLSSLHRQQPGHGPAIDAEDPMAPDNELITAATRLAGMDLHDKRGALSTEAMFFALMARLKTTPNTNATNPETTGPDSILPHEAIQVDDQVIAALKALRIGPALELHAFLARFGDARDARLERILSDFCSAATDMKLNGVPWYPPPRSAGLMLLLHSRLLIENNAHRMKGWGGLHPSFENQAGLLSLCAEKLEAMAVHGNHAVDDAFASGDIYAASAKLLKCLHVIMLGWKAKLDSNSAGAPSSAASAESTAAATATSVEAAQSDPSSSTDLPGTDTSTRSFDPLDDFDFDELFAQWSNWPRADMLDLSQFLPWENI